MVVGWGRHLGHSEALLGCLFGHPIERADLCPGRTRGTRLPGSIGLQVLKTLAGQADRVQTIKQVRGVLQCGDGFGQAAAGRWR